MTFRISFISLLILSVSVLNLSAGFFDELNLSGTFESQYWNNDPEDWNKETCPVYEGPYISFENNLSLNLDYQKFFAEIRLRNMDYKDPIHFDPKSREHETDFELFKATAGYRSEKFKIIAGDFYQALSKGLILYVQEDKELNLDRSIQGGNVTVLLDPVEFNVFGGKIKWYKFKDDVYEELIKTFKIEDEILGGRISARLPANISIGASYSAVSLTDIFLDEYEEEDLALGEIDFAMSGIGNFLDLYGEYAEMKWDSEEPFGSEQEDGKALYTSATMFFGPVTVLAEYKDYDYWNYRYCRPPTADRDDEEAEVEDIRGPRLRVDYFFTQTNTLIYLSVSKFDNHAHPGIFGDPIRNRIEHIYGGIEQRWDNLYVQATYGVKKFETIDETHQRGTCDIEYKLNDRNSLNLYYEYKSTETESIQKKEHKSYLTYSISPFIAITAHFNRHTFDCSFSESTEDDWVAGEVVVTPISGLSVSMLYGKLPPGTVCSGGQCRVVPEFEGFQASLSYRF